MAEKRACQVTVMPVLVVRTSAFALIVNHVLYVVASVILAFACTTKRTSNPQ